ncbi:hypothetical protein BKA66DRAFT_439747 [Pyrenochaeta sp. MPI-SDFR-AT-0127]|nr:hypothetical protein BKA66DRAFT_439747 [Pyrenochaeta sp. MPI-SDFR-AT-0127]
MIPSPVTRISSRTSPSQIATHQGKEQTMRQIVEGEDEIHSFEDTSVVTIGKTEPDVAQKMTSVEHLMINMVDGQRVRHAKRTNDVNTAYNNSYKEYHDSFNILFSDHEEKICSFQKAQLKSLRNLLAQKVKVEAALADRLSVLQTILDAHSHDLEVVIRLRIKEIN